MSCNSLLVIATCAVKVIKEIFLKSSALSLECSGHGRSAVNVWGTETAGATVPAAVGCCHTGSITPKQAATRLPVPLVLFSGFLSQNQMGIAEPSAQCL